jgi:splicing factor 3A subunit 3
VDSDEEEAIYNPLKLPMGWDGKPIPYWLYKLHGLNQEFKCEICGNASYWGRRAFERHFKEWRHQNGMRALGIPNNKNFYEVTQIDDALQLWKTMQERSRGGFKAEMDEEFEDRLGNVYSRKTYEDMKRQGLID